MLKPAEQPPLGTHPALRLWHPSGRAHSSAVPSPIPPQIPDSQKDVGSNHAVSALKFRILTNFMKLGYSVFLSGGQPARALQAGTQRCCGGATCLRCPPACFAAVRPAC